MDPAREDVADGRELLRDLRRAHVPVALAEVATEPIAPLVEAREAPARLGALAVGDGEDPDLVVVGRGDLEGAVLHLGELELHVALAAEHPDVPHEDVPELEPLALALALDHEGRGLGARRLRGERDPPATIIARRRRGGRAAELHGDLLPRAGPAPDCDGLIALQDHVRLEQVADAQALRHGGDVHHVLPRHLRGGAGRDRRGAEQEQSQAHPPSQETGARSEVASGCVLHGVELSGSGCTSSEPAPLSRPGYEDTGPRGDRADGLTDLRYPWEVADPPCAAPPPPP